MVFTLVNLRSFSNKKLDGTSKVYYVAMVIDQDGNTTTIFVKEDVYKFLQNHLFKNVSEYISIKFDRQSGKYSLFIDK